MLVTFAALSQHFSPQEASVTFAAADELSQQNGQNTPTFALLTPRGRVIYSD